jgi:hypothetical protein
LNTTEVVFAPNANVATFTPTPSPRVFNLPIILARRVGTVADGKNTMIEIRAAGLIKDAAVVVLYRHGIDSDRDGLTRNSTHQCTLTTRDITVPRDSHLLLTRFLAIALGSSVFVVVFCAKATV